MQIGIRAFEDSLNLQQKKQPLIHCISNPVFSEILEESVVNYNGKTIISNFVEKYVEITPKANALIITFDELNEDKVVAIEKSIRIARRSGIPVILDILGVDASFFSKEIALRFINRYNINMIIGKTQEFKSLALKKEKLEKDILLNYKIEEDAKFRYNLRKFSKIYRTKLLVKSNKYFLTDGFSEFYIDRYIYELDRKDKCEVVLSGLISIGIASASNTEESFRGILVAIIAMAVSEKIAKQKSMNCGKDIDLLKYLLNEIKDINLDELPQINYLFIR